MLQNTSIEVNAQYPLQYDLRIEVNNHNGGTTSPRPGIVKVDYGLSVQVQALPYTGYVFNGWYLNGIYQHDLETISVTMIHDNVLMAAFSQQAMNLTITTNPPEGGFTNPPPGTSFYQYGSDILVSVQINDGYLFDGWYLDGQYLGNHTSISVEMVEHRDVGAFFTEISPEEPEEPEEPPVQLPPANLTVSCESYATYSDFNVQISGDLRADGVAIPGSGILIYVSVTGGETWDVLSFVNTDANGEFSVSWKPSVTGTFLLNATWGGNSNYSSTYSLVNFAVTPYKEESVFSVTSNSTLSGLIFDSETGDLGFSVTGPSGTVGYTDVVIPKSLISDVSNLSVYLDGEKTSFTSVEESNSWQIHFTYAHSTHQVVVSLDSQIPSDPEEPTTPEEPTDPEAPEEPTDPSPEEPEEPEDPEEPTDPQQVDDTGSITIPIELLLGIIVVGIIIVVAVVGYKLGKSKRSI